MRRLLPLAVMVLAGATALAAPPPPAPPQAVAGMHPESHAPEDGRAPPAANPTPRRITRSGVLVHGRWRVTAGHIRACRHRYRTYNARTDRYVARRGVVRRCVL